jgi:DNA-binding NarL/FixJ family response regulator
MSRLQSANSKKKTFFKPEKRIFVWVDQVKNPVLMVTVSEEKEAFDIANLAKSLFGDQKLEMTIIDMSSDNSIIIEKFNQLFSIKNPKEEGVTPEKSTKPLFSNRELEILQLIAREYTNEEIADKLCLAKRTVDNHRVNLMQRANAKNTAGLMGYAFRNGLLV